MHGWFLFYSLRAILNRIRASFSDSKNENALTKAVHSKNCDVVELLKDTGGNLTQTALELGKFNCLI